MIFTVVMLLLIGVVVGMISSFFGIGGGIVAIPAMYILFPDWPASLILGTSLLMALLNSMRNLRAFVKSGLQPQWSFVASIVAFILLGNFVGRQVVQHLSTLELKRAFALFLVVIVLKLLFFHPKVSHVLAQDWHPPKTLWKRVIIGFLMGFISVVIGVGGGVLAVPMLMVLFAMPLIWIPVYSHSLMIVSTTFGVIAFLTLSPPTQEVWMSSWKVGSVQVLVSLLIFLGGSVSYKWGLHLQNRLPDKIKKRIFAGFLLLVAIKMSGFF